jgi:hypothetical protein
MSETVVVDNLIHPLTAGNVNAPIFSSESTEPQVKRSKIVDTSSNDSIKLTDSLRSYYKYIYVLRIDNEDLFYCYSEDEAKECANLLIEKIKSETNCANDCMVEIVSGFTFNLSKVNKGYIYNSITPLNKIEIIKVNRLSVIY